MTESSDQPLAGPAALVFDHVVVGASDKEATLAFLAEFGLEPVGGSAANGEGTFAGVPGEQGAIRVRQVEAAEHNLPGSGRQPYRTGGHALDLYTRDMDASVRQIDALGLRRGPAVSYAFGPMSLGQVMVYGPDDVAVVLVSIDQRLPSALDGDSGRLHSQLHSMVWTVDATQFDEATEFFGGAAGLTLRATFPLTEPAVAEFMELPRPSPMRMSVLSHEDARPPRFELLAYDADVAAPGEAERRSSRPLIPGVLLPVFTTTDLASAQDLLGGSRSTDSLGPRLDATAPGGVEVEVREVAAGNVGPFYARVL